MDIIHGPNVRLETRGCVECAECVCLCECVFDCQVFFVFSFLFFCFFFFVFLFPRLNNQASKMYPIHTSLISNIKQARYSIQCSYTEYIQYTTGVEPDQFLDGRCWEKEMSTSNCLQDAI